MIFEHGVNLLRSQDVSHKCPNIIIRDVQVNKNEFECNAICNYKYLDTLYHTKNNYLSRSCKFCSKVDTLYWTYRTDFNISFILHNGHVNLIFSKLSFNCRINNILARTKLRENLLDIIIDLNESLGIYGTFDSEVESYMLNSPISYLSYKLAECILVSNIHFFGFSKEEISNISYELNLNLSSPANYKFRDNKLKSKFDYSLEQMLQAHRKRADNLSLLIKNKLKTSNTALNTLDANIKVLQRRIILLEGSIKVLEDRIKYVNDVKAYLKSVGLLGDKKEVIEEGIYFD